MEYLIPIIIIVISLGIYVFLLFIAKVNITFFKKNFPSIISYLILILIFFNIFKNIPLIKEILNNNTSITSSFINRFIIFMCACGVSIIVVSPIVGIIQKIKENNIIKKYEPKYKFTNYKYYRDIVGDIPPAMLSIIYNRHINIEDQIISTIIYLKEKQVINYNNNKIIVMNNQEQLLEHEKKIIEYVNGTINNYEFSNDYSSSLMTDLEKQGYVKIKSDDFMDMTELMQLTVIWIIISLLILMPTTVPLSEMGVLLIFPYLFAFISIPFYKLISKKIIPVIRTDKALELSSKLNGLKNFLKDFTIINDKQIEEIKLYDDYILYGIIFDLKGSLNNQSKELYNSIKKTLKNNNNNNLK